VEPLESLEILEASAPLFLIPINSQQSIESKIFFKKAGEEIFMHITSI